MKYEYSAIENMSLDQVETRLTSLNIEVKAMQTVAEVDAATKYRDSLIEQRDDLKALETRKQTALNITNGTAKGARVIERSVPMGYKGANMELENRAEQSEIEVRAFQKFILHQQMDEVEKRALAISGAAAVLPVQIMNNLITSELYSDLLYRATVINEPNVGTMLIPVANNVGSVWHTENAAGPDSTPTLTSISLGGYENLGLFPVSANTMSRSTGEFQQMMLNLLSAENIETLEASFITGVGTTQPLGLDAMTWGAGNQVLTASAATPIAATHIAQAMALLPQKYGRGAIVLCNSDTLYNTISLQKGTAEYAFSMSEGAQKFLGKPIVVSEHMADDVIYIVDPKQLYVRFSMPITVQADASAGFTTATIWLRALCVVDAKFNPAACVRIGLGA